MTKNLRFDPLKLFVSPNKFKQSIISAAIGLAIALAFYIHGVSQEPRLPQASTAAELYANQSNDDLTLNFSSAINSAKHSVLLLIYSLTDPEIISSLRKMGDQGLDVRVICDAKTSSYIDSKLGPNVTTIRRFSPGLMHQKILVIDNEQIWLGSANMTTESLRLHGNLVAAMISPQMAKNITDKALTLKVEGRESLFSHQNFTIGNQPIELWFLPDNSGAIARLKSLMQSAKKSMQIAMFTWTRKDLAQEVINANQRGVKTEVVIDHYAGKGASAKIVKLLKKNGISVALSRGGPLLHHKFMYIDGTTLVNGSANWTKAAFTQNDDCFMIMHNLTVEQKAKMDKLWSIISAEAEEPR